MTIRLFLNLLLNYFSQKTNRQTSQNHIPNVLLIFHLHLPYNLYLRIPHSHTIFPLTIFPYTLYISHTLLLYTLIHTHIHFQAHTRYSHTLPYTHTRLPMTSHPYTSYIFLTLLHTSYPSSLTIHTLLTQHTHKDPHHIQRLLIPYTHPIQPTHSLHTYTSRPFTHPFSPRMKYSFVYTL